jgi:hypothetical protein
MLFEERFPTEDIHIPSPFPKLSSETTSNEFRRQTSLSMDIPESTLHCTIE